MRLIDADALKESMRGKFFDSVEEWTAIREIDEAPTIEPKRGEWILDEKGYFSCSVCGHKPYNQHSMTNFCPNCGADMRKEGE